MNEWKEAIFWRVVFFNSWIIYLSCFPVIYWTVIFMEHLPLGRQGLPSQRMVLDQRQPPAIVRVNDLDAWLCRLGLPWDPVQVLCLFGETEVHRDFCPFQTPFYFKPSDTRQLFTKELQRGSPIQDRCAENTTPSHSLGSFVKSKLLFSCWLIDSNSTLSLGPQCDRAKDFRGRGWNKLGIDIWVKL